METLTIEAINNSFKTRSIILDESSNKDDVCFYYERGTDNFTFSQEENKPYGIYDTSIETVNNGLAYYDSEFNQVSSTRDKILVASNALVPGSVSSCYLMLGNSATNTVGKSNYSEFITSDPSDENSSTESGFLGNLTIRTLSFIYNNMKRFDFIDWPSEGTVNEPTIDGETLFDYLFENDQYFHYIENILAENESSVGDRTYTLETNCSIDVFGESYVGKKSITIKSTTLTFVFKNNDTGQSYTHKIKAYFDPDVFIKNHIGSIDSIEIYAFNDFNSLETVTPSELSDILISYGTKTFSTITAESGGFYDTDDSILDSLAWDSTVSQKRYRRHNNFKSIYMFRNVYQSTEKGIKKEPNTDKCIIKQKFIIYHSLESDIEIEGTNKIVREKIMSYIYNNLKDKENVVKPLFDDSFVKEGELNVDYDTALRNVIRHVYQSLNYYSFLVMRKMNASTFNATENVLKTEPFSSDVDSGEYAYIVTPCIYDYGEKKEEVMKTKYLAYYSSLSDDSTDFNNYYPVDLESLSVSSSENDADFLRRVISNCIYYKIDDTFDIETNTTGYKNVRVSFYVSNGEKKMCHFDLNGCVYGIDISKTSFPNNIFEILQKLY